MAPVAQGEFWQWLVQDEIHKLFTETVYLYPCLLPIVDDDDSLAVVAKGEVPALKELRLQQSAVWLWNRPIYDDSAASWQLDSFNKLSKKNDVHAASHKMLERYYEQSMANIPVSQWQ